jgi:hypothetical protein
MLDLQLEIETNLAFATGLIAVLAIFIYIFAVGFAALKI